MIAFRPYFAKQTNFADYQEPQTRADIEQTLVREPGVLVTEIRTAGYAEPGDGGGALYKWVDAEPIHALKVQSADGAWWELSPDSAGINVRQAGAVGDGVTDDGQAFLDAIDGAGDFNANGVNVAVNRVIVPPGSYNLATTTLELKKMVHLTGLGSGQNTPAQPAELHWDANVTGIIVHRENTLGAGKETTGTGTGGGSIIEGLSLQGGGGTIAGVTDDTKGHGIWLRNRAVLRDLIIDGFAGNGLNVVATAGSGDDAREGNANEWYLETARIRGNHQNGIYADGADANAGLATKVDVTGNGRWGIYDASFLGNTYLAAHAAANGRAGTGENDSDESAFVTFGGRRYSANVNATEAQLVATEPGTDETVWLDTTSGGSSSAVPLWESGKAEGTYFHGGSFHSDNANGHVSFFGAYAENNQAKAQFVYPTLYFAGEGFTPAGTYGGMGAIAQGARLFGEVLVRNQDVHSPDRDLEMRFNDRDNVPLSFHVDGDTATGWAWKWEEGEGHLALLHADLNSRRSIRLTTDLNSVSYGRASNLPGGQIILNNGFWIGKNSATTRFFWQDNAAPTSGEHAKGDTILNASPGVQTDTDGIDWIIYGWKCTASGSPGTWQTLWTRVSTPPGL